MSCVACVCVLRPADWLYVFGCCFPQVFRGDFDSDSELDTTIKVRTRGCRGHFCLHGTSSSPSIFFVVFSSSPSLFFPFLFLSFFFSPFLSLHLFFFFFFPSPSPPPPAGVGVSWPWRCKIHHSLRKLGSQLVDETDGRQRVFPFATKIATVTSYSKLSGPRHKSTSHTCTMEAKGRRNVDISLALSSYYCVIFGRLTPRVIS